LDARWLFLSGGERRRAEKARNGMERGGRIWKGRGEEGETNCLVGLLVNAITSFDISEGGVRTSINGLRYAIAVHFTNFCI
jgi:hypothetical protein